jgi:hypothetical protein
MMPPSLFSLPCRQSATPSADAIIELLAFFDAITPAADDADIIAFHYYLH